MRDTSLPAERKRGRFFVPGRSELNSFAPWTNLELDFSCKVQTYTPVQSNSPSLLKGTFLPSVLEDDFYKPLSKPLWIPPLYSQSVQYSYKFHTITVEPLTTIFIGRNFQLLLLRQTLLHMLPFLEDQVARMESERLEDDSDDEELLEGEKPRPSGPPLDLDTQARKCGWSIIREIATIATRRTLSFWAAERLKRRIAWKLTKDLSNSAIRKTSRGLTRFTASQRMFRTTLRGYLLAVAASWLVQFAHDAYVTFKQDASPNALRALAQKTTRSTLRNLAYLLAAAAGASVGTLMWPGRGTALGLIGGTLAADYMLPVLETYLKSRFGGGNLDFAPL